MADCDREFEVLECASSGRAGEELAAHLAACTTCRDLFDVVRAFSQDRTALMHDARIPTAGVVWWRNSMREKREAAQTALRAGHAVEIALVVLAIFIAIGIIGVSIDLETVMRILADSKRIFAIPLFAIVSLVIFTPIALYFAIAPDRR